MQHHLTSDKNLPCDIYNPNYPTCEEGDDLLGDFGSFYYYL